jgi:hypothetical protein
MASDSQEELSGDPSMTTTGGRHHVQYSVHKLAPRAIVWQRSKFVSRHLVSRVRHRFRPVTVILSWEVAQVIDHRQVQKISPQRTQRSDAEDAEELGDLRVFLRVLCGKRNALTVRRT